MDANDQHAIEIAIAAVVSEPSAPEQPSASQKNEVVAHKTFEKILALQNTSTGVTPQVVTDNTDISNDRITFQKTEDNHGYFVRYSKKGDPLPSDKEDSTLMINNITPTYMIITDTQTTTVTKKPEKSEPGIHLEIYHIPDDNNMLFYVKHLNP